MVQGAPVVDDLMDGVFLRWFIDREDVDKRVRRGGEEKRRMLRVEREVCDGVGVGFKEGKQRGARLARIVEEDRALTRAVFEKLNASCEERLRWVAFQS